MSTDLITAETWAALQTMSGDDVARAALLVSEVQVFFGVVTGAFVPYALMKTILDETARRQQADRAADRAERLEEKQADRAERLKEKQADRAESRILIAVVLIAASCLAIYLKN